MASESNQLTQALLRSCSILLKNEKLSPDGIYDELSKILFMKNQYDLKCRKSGKGFSPVEFRRFLNRLDEEIKREMKDERLNEKSFNYQINQTGLEQIIEEISKFNLAELPGDVKGNAYDALIDRTLKKSVLHFFTPHPLVEFMVNILDPCPGELICDPCCGSGSFPVSTFLYLKEKILKPPSESYKRYIEKNDLVKMSNDCIFGADANPRMAWTSKLNMMMHGGGHEGIHLGDGLLNNRGIFDGRFDVVFANPPFGGQVNNSLKISPRDCMTEEEIPDYGLRMGDHAANSLKQVISKVGRPILELFELGKITKLTEVIFMERCLQLLKPGGRMGIILPEGVLNSDKLKKAREYIEGKAKLILVASLPNEVFRHLGVNVKTSIVFLKKFTIGEEAHYKNILEVATRAANRKYEKALRKLQYSTKGEKPAKQTLKNMLAKKEDEIKNVVNEKFDYEILMFCASMIEVKDKIVLDETQMNEIVKEYISYRKKKKLWKS